MVRLLKTLGLDSGRKNSLKHITPSLHVPLWCAVISDVFTDSVMPEFGRPSDVVVMSVGELDISSLTGAV